ncbi:MAG: PQQ-binding-like beta-propeller repeat protein [Algisphaera sp.]
MFLLRRPSTLSFLFAATFALTALTGCDTTPTPTSGAVVVPQPKADFNTGYPIEPGHARTLDYDVRWVRDLALAPRQEVTHLIETSDLIISIESPNNMITAIELATGKPLWKSVVGSRLEVLVGMTSDEKSIYINSTSRIFTLSRHSGEIKRIVDLEYPVSGSPLRVDRLAVFGSETGVLFAYHLDSGYTRWAYGLKDPIRASPAVAGLHLFAIDSGGHYAMLNITSGQLLWRGQLYGDISTNPLLHDGFLILACEDQSMYSLTTDNGKDRWPVFRSEAVLTETPLAAGNHIFVNEPDHGFSAVAADTGERQWFFGGDVRPCFADTQRVLAEGQDVLVALDSATGNVLTSVPTQPLQSIRANSDGHLLLLTPQGEIMRLAPSTAIAPVIIEPTKAATESDADADAQATPDANADPDTDMDADAAPAQ